MAVTTTPLSSPIATKLLKDTDSDATAEADVLSGTGTIFMVTIDNTANGAVSYTKIYDAASATVGTTAPDFILRTTASTKQTFVFGAPGSGVALTTGLTFATVTAAGTAGTTSPTSNVIVEIMAS
jgi:hypothetical protein